MQQLIRIVICLCCVTIFILENQSNDKTAFPLLVIIILRIAKNFNVEQKKRRVLHVSANTVVTRAIFYKMSPSVLKGYLSANKIEFLILFS